jgi:glycosyltransferase involved in cell wall biosynthesis
MMRRKQVVIIQEYVPLYRAAFFNVLIERAEALGVHIIVAHGRPSGGQSRRGDAVQLAGSLEIRHREIRIAGRRLIVRFLPKRIRQADLLILEQARRNVDAYRLFLPRWMRRPRTIALWGHGRDYTTDATRAERLINRNLTSRSDWFFGYTARGVAHVVENGFDARRTTVVRNSTDTESFIAELDALTADDLRKFKDKHSLSGRTALYIGGLDQSKLIPLLLESADAVAQTDPEFRLLVAGDGADRSLVEDASRRKAHVQYLGSIDGKVKALAFACSQILTVPGRVGLVAVDSIAAGLPLVTTDWDLHAPEYEYLDDTTRVETYQTGRDYADGINKLLGDSYRLATMSSALLSMRRDFGVGPMAENYLAGILAALEQRR